MRPIEDHVWLADRVRALRETQGLTQRELAARVGIDRATVQRLERRPSGAGPSYRPSTRTLQALADCFGVAPKRLHPGHRAPPKPVPRPGPDEPGAVIRRLRRARRLSIGELAERVPCNPRTVERYGSGESTEPKGRVYCGIPRALGVEPEAVWGPGPHRFIFTAPLYSVLDELEPDGEI